jgi:hypothetical protein
MAQYSFVVISDAVPGREEEYNAWYNEQHLKDVLKVPGFVAARRFKLAQDESKLPGRYLALYEIETDDAQAALADLVSRAGTPDMVMSEAMDMSKVSATLFAAIGDKQTVAR